MGKKKKKPFINKNEAQTYRLVPRSQHDPLAGDVDESQYVLKAQDTQRATEEERVTEQKKCGVYYEDEYDYLQHLKPPGTALLEPVGMAPDRKEENTVTALLEPVGMAPDRKEENTGKMAILPEELFGHEVRVQGHLDKVLPVSGPRPDWDPEIVEALENAEICTESDQQLEDNFVMLANSGEPGLPVYVTEHHDLAVPDDPWWKGRGDFDHLHPAQGESSAEDDSGASISSGEESLGDSDRNQSENRTAQFTQYSMTSSVIPRSEALTLMDDQFEKFMVGYNDDQLGAGEEEEEADDDECVASTEPPRQSEYDQLLLQMAVQDFEKNFLDDSKYGTDKGSCHDEEVESKGEGSGSADDKGKGAESETDGSTTEEELDLVEMNETPKEERWDCESILSTYSTLYNHPTKIVEPRTQAFSSENRKIKLSKKTGIPLGVIPGPLPKETHPSRGTVTRPKNESKDERKARKLALKEDRKQRRADKKATKMVFKAEAMKQGKVLQSSLSHMAAIV